MLHEYVGFNDFIIYLGTGVLFCLAPSFAFTKWFYRNQEGWDQTLTADGETHQILLRELLISICFDTAPCRVPL